MASDFQSFNQTFQAGQSQILSHWTPADLETPVSAYMKLCQNQAYSILLESVEGGATIGRYSAIGFEPDTLWRYQDGQISVKSDGDWAIRETDCVLEDLRTLVNDSKIDVLPDDAPPMAGSGLFGFMGYDMIRLIEDIPAGNPDPLNMPESVFMRPQIMVVFDNVRQMMCITTPVRLHKDNTDRSAQSVFDEAYQRIQEVLIKLGCAVPASNARTSIPLPLTVTSNLMREEYHDMVRRGVEHIYAGDIFQFVPSQRFSTPFDLPPLALYRSLRRLNPSPFLFLVQMDEFALVGSSPEILVRVRDEVVTIRPIAGTRPRGKTAAEDKALAEGLLKDPKERAEHLMLLDLGRNDVGQVAEIGSVKVTDDFIIEYYSHVMHIISNVEGKLAKDKDSLDALFAGFPAGTVSGAPKIRAMEIIEELEPVKRSFYAGCVGYLDGRGDIDTCISLRTGLIKDGMLYIQAGGGVVADSDPEYEYQESCNKARALIVAAEDAIALATTQNSARKAS